MRKFLGILGVVATSLTVLTGCSEGNDKASESKIQVVTSTNVYAEIVQEIAGDTVEVKALVNSTSQDPHSYEATAVDRLTVKDANIVVINGGGYDHFLENLAGTDNSDQKIINAAQTSELFDDEELKELTEGHSSEHHDHHHDHGELNEHIWYSFTGMSKVADEIANQLSETAPEHAQQYQEGAKKFSEDMDKLTTSANAIKAEGKKYLATEPVPGYLLETAGLKNVTPEDLTSAVEEDSDIPPLTLQNVRESLQNHSIDVVAFNEQTATAQTKQILSTAQSNKVPTVSFTETIPENQTYTQWMENNVNNLREVLTTAHE